MILKALGERLLSFLILSFFLFILIRALPGDPVEVLMGEFAVPMEKQRVRQSLGLDKPLLEQASSFYSGLIKLDFGVSFTRQKPVSLFLKDYLVQTLKLTGLAFFVAQVLGLCWAFANIFLPGVFFQRASNALSAAFLSVPSFWLGPLLISVFCLGWPWLPLAESNQAGAIVLPALTLSLGFAAILQKTTTLELRKTLATDYARTAAAKGASTFRIVAVHALPNALIPLVSYSMIKLAQLLTGALIVEGIFHWPGLGQLMLDAVLQRDYPTLQGITLLICFFYSVAGFASDSFQTLLMRRTHNVDATL